MEKKNNAIEFYRFLFSIIVCLYHFRTYAPAENYPFSGGYLAVEFFFILSGVFLAQKVARMEQTKDWGKISADSVHYLLGRVKRLYPHYLLAVLCLAVYRICIHKYVGLKEWLQTGVSEILMLQSAGTGDVLSVVFWFPSALILATFCVFFLMRWNKHVCAKVLFPIASLGIISSLLQANNTLDVTFSYHLVFSDGFWRALAGLMIGCTCYEIIEYTREHVAKINPLVVTLAEVILLAIVLVILYTPNYREKNYVAVIIFIVFIILLMSQTSFLSKILDGRVTGYLGKISYGVYLNQNLFFSPLIVFFPYNSQRPFWKMAIIYIVLVILFSVITTWVVDVFTKRVLNKKN